VTRKFRRKLFVTGSETTGMDIGVCALRPASSWGGGAACLGASHARRWCASRLPSGLLDTHAVRARARFMLCGW
jgi:hypothetical protein